MAIEIDDHLRKMLEDEGTEGVQHQIIAWMLEECPHCSVEATVQQSKKGKT